MADYQVQAILDAATILDFFGATQRMASFEEIRSATGISGANLTRALRSLKTAGYAGEPASQRWVAGPRLAVAAAGALSGRLARAALELEQIIHALQQIKRETDERPRA